MTSDREIVGKRLRECRKAKKITAKALAELTGYSAAAISKFERGLLRPNEDFIEATIKVLGLSKAEAVPLRELGALFNSQFQRWNSNSKDVGKMQEVLGQREQNANMIRAYCDPIVHGLLQEESYMRAIFQSCINESDLAIEKIIKRRINRQNILRNENKTLIFVLNEICLRTCIISKDILKNQLLHLEKLIKSLPKTEIRVLPFSHALKVFSIHQFTIFDERTVSVELNEGQIDLWKESEVKNHIDIMNYLVSVSLPTNNSLDFITATRKDL